MIRKYATQAVELTQHIMEEYWQKNPEPLIEHLHENVLWIGSMNEEYLHGKDLCIRSHAGKLYSTLFILCIACNGSCYMGTMAAGGIYMKVAVCIVAGIRNLDVLI